ncbi:hypothetical protein Rsub_02763 [Raphidocelis subcapitata]|uniref:Ubiquitin-like domain-containing protein n=1 Tax=Raphidocelis subcapitata TaxID=307507 RepID=A0A2V0NZ16_9CHLO|nr:hypothetical protein Rsub_02763 [Raphidocelis subcapitata]|eukprot:GBF90055.1 hypothetical protein Rsub_02763 [Raphidocelis subcapitata]
MAEESAPAEAPVAAQAMPVAAAAPAAPAAVADAPPPSADAPAAGADAAAPCVAFSLTWGKQKTELKRRADSTVSELKAEVARLWGVPAGRQKLMFRGLVKDEAATLAKVGIKDGAKVLLIGSRDEDVAAAAPKEAAGGPAAWDAAPVPEEPLGKQAQHAKVLAKGKPEDALPGISGRQVPLPEGQSAIPGLLNSQGTKVRLTFRPDLGQLWIGSATATQKVSYGSVRAIEAAPIDGDEGYSIVALVLGAGKLFLYFFPSQLVSTLKMRVLGLGALLV